MNTRTPLIIALLLSTALRAPAYAADVTADILAQPAMTEGARSLPEPQPAAVPALAPATPPAPAPATAEAPQAVAAPQATPAAAKVEIKAEMVPQINEILAAAYASSPVLQAEREALRQQYENVIQARANWKPSVAVEGGATAQRTKTKPGTSDSFVARDVGLTASQYLYRGGRTLAEVDQQLKLSDAAQASYDSAVQNTFLNVVTALMDIQQARATIDLNTKNHEVLSRQLDAAQRGFEVGSLTRTDVAQSQARLSGAEANIVAAKAEYSSALARFMRYAGQPGDSITIPMETVSTPLPASLDEAISIADAQNPDIKAARLAAEAATHGIDIAAGAMKPTLSLNGALSAAWDPSSVLDESDGASIGVRASMPLYQGGALRSLVRQAKSGAAEKQNMVEDASRTIKQGVTTAWNDYLAANATIEAFKKQVDAAQLARDGAYKEREVGTRTVLDTLNADAELLDAQVSLIRARRNAVVSSYALLASIGGLTGEKTGIGKMSRE